MKLFYSFLLFATSGYLLAMAALYYFQRNLLYNPVPAQNHVPHQQVTIHHHELALNGWVLNPGKAKALIYFGGNAEVITNNISQFEIFFKDYSVYLINYRGYGGNQGRPTEAGLFSDASAIYDRLKTEHASISLMGRSLGSGVAVYLASRSRIEKLLLLTPYDSIAEVAQTHYPYFPTRFLVQDRFESIKYAPLVTAPVLIVSAEFDRVVPLKHTLKLRDYFSASSVRYTLIERATHNDITEFVQYHDVLNAFASE